MKLKKKGFVKYFFSTFKQGRYLLLKYLASAVLMSVIAILANLLGVEELTYLNAFLAVNYFSTMIAFGLSGSMNVFINQNIKSKHSVKRFANMGLQMNFILISIFTIILVCFPQFIMENLAGYLPQDYTFYYIMCAYFFLCGISGYVQDILRELQVYKSQFISDITPLIITVVGLVVLYFSGIYYLNYIAIVYIVSAIVGVVLGIVLLMKNKTYKLNIFSFSKVKFTKKQWLIVLANFAIEFIWEIGYFATATFLLRINDGIFNTYSYLEQVLDIANGFLFAYINVTCIQITRSLGRSRFDYAYKHAKNSIYGALIIWAGYFIISMALIYPIALGANNEYFNLMFLAVPCYGLIHLFRFLTWNFGSYMLRLGGKNKVMVIMECLSTAWLVGICFLVIYLPVNIFLAYFLITVPDIICLPIDFFIFKRKKWMVNINDDPNLLKNKVKCVIFDFDDTLYYGVNWHFWYIMVGRWFNEHFAYMSEQERKALLKKYKCKSRFAAGGGLRLSDEKLCKILIDVEGSATPWLDYRDNLDLDPAEKKGKAIPRAELEKFAKLGKLYIVSNSRLSNIKKSAEFYKIDLDMFEKIYSNEYNSADTSKTRYLKEIMEENNLKPENILMIGDSKAHDIAPAKKLKMNTYRCFHGFTYNDVMD